MTIIETTEDLITLKSLLLENSEFWELVTALSSLYDEAHNNFILFAANFNKESGKAAASNSYAQLEQVQNAIRNTSLGTIFRQKEQIKRILENYKSFDEYECEQIIELLDNFERLYESCLKKFNASNAANLSAIATQLLGKFNALEKLLNFLTKHTNKSIVKRNNEEELLLSLPYVENYDEIISKLINLDKLYSELCLLNNISVSEYPIKVVKIETGSLLIYIIGNAIIIGFIIWILKEVIRFIYRNYTNEGKISAIPRQLESVDAILQFTNKLEEHGIDTTKNKEQLQLVTARITDNLNNLVLDQPKISINGEELSVGNELENKYLKEREQLLIGDGTDNEETSNNK